MAAIEKIVIITRETRLDGLKKEFNTPSQASFVLGQAKVRARMEKCSAPMGSSNSFMAEAMEEAKKEFKDVVTEYDEYQRSIELLNRELDFGLKVQVIDRSLVPTFLFTDTDLVITVGQDGLVANCAKYVGDQPILAVNPAPKRFDGVLLPFRTNEVRREAERVINGRAAFREVTLAEVRLNDGQRMLAFNDFFIGARSHVSARYRILAGDRTEDHSSSGIIVSTGAGSTGWLSSMFNMASGLAGGAGLLERPRMDWEDPRLFFVVREPFLSKSSQAGIFSGWVDEGSPLQIESQMAAGGVIFSDGVESDPLNFLSGLTATIGPAKQKARLVVRG